MFLGRQIFQSVTRRAVVGQRRCLSDSQGQASRQARIKQQQAKKATPGAAGSSGGQQGSSSAKASSGGTTLAASLTVIFSAMTYLVYDYYQDPRSALVNGTPLAQYFRRFYDYTHELVEDPYSEKLIPDWPTDPLYAAENVPPGTPARILLVLDVEKTLLGIEYDARFGFRYYKRPGLDQFIRQLQYYYEIVLFCESDGSLEAANALMGTAGIHMHVLGPQAASHTKEGHLQKRVDLMNRDVARIIVIDDDKDSIALCKRNSLLVPSYDEPNDDDTVLLDMIPLLQSIVHHQKQDVREIFDNLGTNDGVEASTEYRRRVWQSKNAIESKKNRGLGRIIRSTRGSGGGSSDNESAEQKEEKIKAIMGEPVAKGSALTTSKMMHAKTDEKLKLPGDKKTEVKPSEKKKGGLFNWVEKNEAAKMEHETRRQEKMQQMMMAKQQAAEEARQKMEH